MKKEQKQQMQGVHDGEQKKQQTKTKQKKENQLKGHF